MKTTKIAISKTNVRYKRVLKDVLNEFGLLDDTPDHIYELLKNY